MGSLISVVIVTYNYGKYLPRALDSILLQDLDDVEVLVVDDGSSDQTRTIVDRYVAVVRYIYQPHQGTFAACRTGLRASGGQWIMFVDADDRLQPGVISALRKAAAANPDAGLIVGRTRSVSVGGQETVHDHPPLSGDPLTNFGRFARGRLHFSIAGGLIRRSLLTQFDREPFDYPHSMDLAILGTGLLRGVVQIDRVTLDVFDHEGRLRDNIMSIHGSGLKLVDVLFDPALLPPAAMRYRRAFLGRIELERTRSYYRVGWYSLSWRSYLRAVAASPGALRSGRNLRRAAMSILFSLLRR